MDELVYLPATLYIQYISATGSPTIGFAFKPDGVMYVRDDNLAFPQLYDDPYFTWLLQGSAGDYWIRATNEGPGPVGSGFLNSWRQMNSNQSWASSTSASGTSFTTTLLLEIATDSLGANIIKSGRITWLVQKL